MAEAVAGVGGIASISDGRKSLRRAASVGWILMQSLIKLAALLHGRAKPMASITIRNLDDPLKSRLRVQAAIHGRSMEDEARDILRTALALEPARPTNLAAAIRKRFAPLGGVELPESPREPMREPPDFGA